MMVSSIQSLMLRLPILKGITGIERRKEIPVQILEILVLQMEINSRMT